MNNIRPDAIDFRDRLYTPNLRPLPAAFNATPFATPAAARVKDQASTSACTGFALSALVENLLAGTPRLAGIRPHPALGQISPFMLYYFARRYDEIPGDDQDEGSTARAAMKAWHKHGAASSASWPSLKYPRGRQWIEDGFKRPLGAYYRVDHTCLPDIHAAISETGVLYATAAVHAGWDTPAASGEIPFSADTQPNGGHAFLLVGYDDTGFWIQNSWGTSWGNGGFGHLKYGDWNRHGWDLWVAQTGVQTSSFVDTLSSGLSLTSAQAGPTPGRLLSSNEAIRAQQLSPFVINLENNGTLSPAGSYSTTTEDLRLLVTHYLPSAAADFGLAASDPIDIAIYAHGGLTPEKSAAETAAKWIPSLYAEKIFPLFIMWETGAADSIGDMLRDALPGGDRVAAGRFSNWLDDRLETAVFGIGTAFWDEMKENAAAATTNPGGGLRTLYQVLSKKGDALLPRLRFHLIGHSAGACFHAYLLPALLGARLRVDGLYFMAPAVRVDTFTTQILPGYKSGKVPCYTQFHLTDEDEQNDNCWIYQKSLLYLVSNAFERKRGTPILGMEKSVTPPPAPPAKAKIWDWIAARTGAPSPNASAASTHGGFGTEPETMRSILDRISARR